MHSLAPLPYGLDALQPYMSADTLSYHHGAHHRGYVDKLNGLVKGTDYERLSLEDTLLNAARRKTAHSQDQAIFNNAAQAWNHDFFWHSMAPPAHLNGASRKPTGLLARLIEAEFGAFDAFCDRFKDAAVSCFGSGWVWLVFDEGRVGVVATANADNPLLDGQTPLLCCDVWEHAYYLDYRHKREAFVTAFLDYLANWDFASAILEDAKDRSALMPPRMGSGLTPGATRHSH